MNSPKRDDLDAATAFVVSRAVNEGMRLRRKYPNRMNGKILPDPPLVLGTFITRIRDSLRPLPLTIPDRPQTGSDEFELTGISSEELAKLAPATARGRSSKFNRGVVFRNAKVGKVVRVTGVVTSYDGDGAVRTGFVEVDSGENVVIHFIGEKSHSSLRKGQRIEFEVLSASKLGAEPILIDRVE